MVQIAIVYESDHIRLYRNSEPYAAYTTNNIALLDIDNHIAVFGLRHVGAGTGTPFAGSIEDARIYSRALTPSEISSLEPNEKSNIDPFAWWDFEGDQVIDRVGRFGHTAMTDGAVLENGRLVLDGKGYLVAARSEADAKLATRKGNPRAPGPPYLPETPAWPEAPPNHWLTFHLAHPGPGDAHPGDPNCAFDHKRRYHLHYIYRSNMGFSFAHVSSNDLVHWKWHTTVLAPPTTGHGMFSGTGFYTKEGEPAIIYHGEGSGRNWIEFPRDDQFDTWSEPVPVLPNTAVGRVPEIRHWDPDCWRNGDTYYALSGGQNPQLMKSTDLKNWTYLGDLLHPDFPPSLDVAKEEDISCANFFKLGDRWMLLCISHALGCRYYLGDFKDEQYLPDFHAKMNWVNTNWQDGHPGLVYFAPESMLTRDGRRVMWAWIMSDRLSPTGVQSLPRELELPNDGVLRIKPLREIQRLRRDQQQWPQMTLHEGIEFPLEPIKGDALELEITFASPLPTECGIKLFTDANGQDGIPIVSGAGRKSLKVGTIEAPFEVREGDDLRLSVFIDKNLVEVFANDRQAVVLAHDQVSANPSIRLFTKEDDAVVESIRAWRMETIHHTPN
jgi:sucrose-6-phosphate hydrolase SacC (GH32 family)